MHQRNFRYGSVRLFVKVCKWIIIKNLVEIHKIMFIHNAQRRKDHQHQKCVYIQHKIWIARIVRWKLEWKCFSFTKFPNTLKYIQSKWYILSISNGHPYSNENWFSKTQSCRVLEFSSFFIKKSVPFYISPFSSGLVLNNGLACCPHHVEKGRSYIYCGTSHWMCCIH